MAIFMILLGAIFASISNFFMRRTLDGGGTPRGFLLLQFGTSLILNIALCAPPLEQMSQAGSTIAMGALGGLCIFGMMWAVGRALRFGPAGLTFAMLNAATVLPGLAMALLFGAAYGFDLTLYQIMGLLLVLLGFFWAVRHERAPGRWLALGSIGLLLHALLMVIMQWHSLLMRWDLPSHPLLPVHLEIAQSGWFLPGMFATAFFAQVLSFAIGERRWPNLAEWMNGLAGGVANGAGAYCLMRGVQAASGSETLMIFPLFAIAIIAFTNGWSQWLYRERVSWGATILCFLGIFLGAVEWRMLLG